MLLTLKVTNTKTFYTMIRNFLHYDICKKNYAPHYTCHYTIKFPHSYPLLFSLVFNKIVILWKNYFLKKRTKQIYTKPLTDSVSILKLKIMWGRALFEILLTSAVTCKKRDFWMQTRLCIIFKIKNAKTLIKVILESPYKHCMKIVQIRSFFWSVFSCIRTEYGDLRIWTLFTQWRFFKRHEKQLP